MKHKIILFDMDGVLLHADGYHRALQSAVNLIGRNLGIKEPNLSKEHIAIFESAGVTHEWETLAICSAILLTQIWHINKNVRIPYNIDPAPNQYLIRGEDHFTNFLQSIDLNGAFPTAYTESFLLNQESHLCAEQISHLKLILRSGLDHKLSPTLLIFQEYVLGSLAFTQIYNRPGQLKTNSYLELYDRAALSKTNHDQLIEWLESDTQHAVIFTNRPSNSPRGFFSTPEAEIGAAAIELQDLPIVGAGSLSWLARLKSMPLQTYFKPNPVHALTALQVALGTPLVQSLNAAIELFNGGYDNRIWLPLEGATIIVFEDLIGGFESAQSAQQILNNIGVDTDLVLIGISNHPIKSKALSPLAHHLISDINQTILPELIS